MNKNVSLAAISLLLVLSVAILYYFATSNYSATGVFWSGSAAGFFYMSIPIITTPSAHIYYSRLVYFWSFSGIKITLKSTENVLN